MGKKAVFWKLQEFEVCRGVEGEPLDRPGEALLAKPKFALNIMSQYVEA